MSAGWCVIDGKRVLPCRICGGTVSFVTEASWRTHILDQHPQSAEAIALRTSVKPKAVA